MNVLKSFLLTFFTLLFALQVLVVTDNLDNMDMTDRISVNSSQALTPTLSNNNQSTKVARRRRTRVPDKPNYPLNLWSIIKNCIGKDLSKIPMPVNFNEPLSMLQRFVVMPSSTIYLNQLDTFFTLQINRRL